jgi:D-glycerate 3-kinase
MAAFEPLAAGNAALTAHAGLPAINELLRPYADWHALVDSWVVLMVDDTNVVFEWRAQAERKMRAAGRGGMSDAQVADFVGRYQPAYGAYLPGLYAAARGTGVGGQPTLAVRVDRERRPVNHLQGCSEP